MTTSLQHGQGSEPGTTPHFVRSLAGFAGLALGLWLVFFAVHVGLPGIRAGADQVYETKLRFINEGRLFDPQAKAKVVVFGNSRVLAGFVPSTFDEAFAGQVSSFNAGIPDATHFVEELEKLLERGEAPTHVLLTNCWGEIRQDEGTRGDDGMMERLFPFRKLARNAVLFLLRSRTRGGPRAYYADVETRLERMIADRGYHFIESQSHFPDHRLPADFRLEGDSPESARARNCPLQGPLFEQLLRLKREGNLSIALVPTYYREHEVGEALSNHKTGRELARYGIDVRGPDYYRFANRLFSDAVHLNQEGAELYTRRLADLVSDLVPIPRAEPEPRRVAHAGERTAKQN